MADIPLFEITLRKYEKPYQTEKREIVKKICLSLGLLQPGDSRDIIVDILFVLIQAQKERKTLSSEEIREKAEKMRKQNNLDARGLAESNIRRQLKRLRDIMLIEKNQNSYRLSEFESLSTIFENKIEKFLIPQIIERTKEYLNEIEKTKKNL